METTEASNTFGGNLLVAQSGGPTAVINSSVAGVIQEAGRHEDIEEIYGGLNGIYGILNEELIDINEEKAKSIEALKHTPAAALGTCRYKINFKTDPDQAAKDMDRLFEVFEAHNIRFFFYAAVLGASQMLIFGVPKMCFSGRHPFHTPFWYTQKPASCVVSAIEG